MEDLNELLPGEQNFHHRRDIMGLINMISQLEMEQRLIPTQDVNKSNITNDKELPRKGTDPEGKESESVQWVDLNDPNEEDKPVILVFMHCCRDPSHMTNNNCLTKCQPSSGNEVHIFHCAYHDSVGLLECQENEQTVAEVHSILQSCADSQAEISQSSVTCTEQDTEQQSMATKNAKTLIITKDDELHRGGPKPVDEGSESEQRMTVPAMEHSTGHSGGHAPEVLQSIVDRANVDMEEKSMAAQDDKRPPITNDSELSRKDIVPVGEERELHQQVFVPALEHSTGPCGAVKVHIAENSSNFHLKFQDTFMKKLNLQIEPCSEESCSVILVFAPFPCQTRTDKEAAMSRVTETSVVSSPGLLSQLFPSSKKMMYPSLDWDRHGGSHGQSYRKQTCHPGVHAPLSQPQSHDRHHSATIQEQHSASRPLRLP